MSSLEHCLDPAMNVQLAIEIGSVPLKRVGGDEEAVSDFAIGETRGQKLQHFQLASSQRLNHARTGRPRLAWAPF